MINLFFFAVSSQEYVNWSLELKDSQDDIAWRSQPHLHSPKVRLPTSEVPAILEDVQA